MWNKKQLAHVLGNAIKKLQVQVYLLDLKLHENNILAICFVQLENTAPTTQPTIYAPSSKTLYLQNIAR